MHTTARDRLIADHMEMAAGCAITVAAQENLLEILSRDDIRAYGQQGLVEAADRYNPDCGIDFRTFSWNRIRGAVVDGARKHRIEGYSRKLHLKFEPLEDEQPPPAAGYRVQIFYDSFRQYHPRPNSERPECAGDTVAATHREPADPDADAPDAQVDRLRLRKALLKAIDALPPRERAVTLRHYYKGESFCDIGAEEGVDNQVIRRLHNKSLRRLRSALSPANLGPLEVLQ